MQYLPFSVLLWEKHRPRPPLITGSGSLSTGQQRWWLGYSECSRLSQESSTPRCDPFPRRRIAVSRYARWLRVCMKCGDNRIVGRFRLVCAESATEPRRTPVPVQTGRCQPCFVLLYGTESSRRAWISPSLFVCVVW